MRVIAKYQFDENKLACEREKYRRSLEVDHTIYLVRKSPAPTLVSQLQHVVKSFNHE